MSTYYADLPQRTQYQNHGSAESYSKISGVYPIPVAELEPTDEEELKTWLPFVPVQAHAPMLTRTVNFNTVKEGGPPQVGAMEDAGEHTFLGGTLVVQKPRLNLDMWSYTWEVDGEYTYLVAGPCSAELRNGLILSSPPNPSNAQIDLNNKLGSTTVPEVGSIRSAGIDVRSCYGEAVGVNFGASYFLRGTSLFPGCFFNTSLLNGDTRLALTVDATQNTVLETHPFPEEIGEFGD